MPPARFQPAIPESETPQAHTLDRAAPRIHLPTLYLLTPWCRVILEKLTGLQLVKKFPHFIQPEGSLSHSTSVSHSSLSWASPIQYIYPHPTSWRSILILSTHLRLGLPSGLFPSGFHSKTLYTLLSSPVCAKCIASTTCWKWTTRSYWPISYLITMVITKPSNIKFTALFYNHAAVKRPTIPIKIPS